MKYYCPCGRFVELIKGVAHTRKGTAKVCRECMERYETADSMAKMALEDSVKDPTLDRLKNIFNMT